MTFTTGPGVYIRDIEPSPPMTTLEEIEKALIKTCKYSLFTPNTECNLHYIKASFTARLHEMHFNGFKICDRDGDPIENVEDCEVVITMSDDEYTVYGSFVPTEKYWNRKLETDARDFEELIITLYADQAMAAFDPSI